MLRVTNLMKAYSIQGGRKFQALDNVGFHVLKGKFFTLLGPSGCGKTTTLRSIAGLERPDSGSIVIGLTTVLDSDARIFVPPNKRHIGMVFQSYAIWPHMNVFENVAFPLRVKKTRILEREIKRKVRRALETVQLAEYEARPATKLSGGQQQRLALARALVMEPDLLLLDEPLSNLDAKLRESMRSELRRLQRDVGITTIYVTHDQAEALALSDEIAVMNQGRIVQLGDPETIYRRPNDRFVATFIGSTNLVPGKVRTAPLSADGEGIVETEDGPLRCRFSDGAAGADAVVVSIRPESVALADPASRAKASETNVLTGRVSERVFLGEVTDYVVTVGKNGFRVRGNPNRTLAVNEAVALHVRHQHCVALPAN